MSTMNFPTFVDTMVVDEHGYWTPTWQQIMTQLCDQLNINLTQTGVLLPQQTTATIAQLNATNPYYYGNITYDVTTNQGKINIAGVYKAINVT